MSHAAVAADAGELADLVLIRASLADRFRLLAASFAGAAAALAQGRPPGAGLGDELARARADFSALAAGIAGQDGAAAPPADLAEAAARLAALVAERSLSAARRRLNAE